jgi:hypothetical protein
MACSKGLGFQHWYIFLPRCRKQTFIGGNLIFFLFWMTMKSLVVVGKQLLAAKETSKTSHPQLGKVYLSKNNKSSTLRV